MQTGSARPTKVTMKKQPLKMRMTEIEPDEDDFRLACDIKRMVKGYRRETKKEKRQKVKPDHHQSRD
jgi:hypothetical protein